MEVGTDSVSTACVLEHISTARVSSTALVADLSSLSTCNACFCAVLLAAPRDAEGAEEATD